MGFDWLPEGLGEVDFGAALAPLTTIKVGGSADVLVTPKDWDAVARLVAAKPEDVPLTVLGLGSNMVIRDGGIAGVVLHLDGVCDGVEVRGDGSEIYAEAGASLGKVARVAREHELDGLAFFGGIPGSVGGGLRMNAGAYGRETYDQLVKLWVMDDKGAVHEKAPGFVAPRYRGTDLPAGWLFVAGQWRLAKGEKEAIRQAMREVNLQRSTTQPLHMPSSGSWFKNVVVTEENVEVVRRTFEGVNVGDKVNAWRVVDAAGCRGMREGGAQVSEQHCNFFVNVGAKESDPVSFNDFSNLSFKVEKEVEGRLGFKIEREVKFYGRD